MKKNSIILTAISLLVVSFMVGSTILMATTNYDGAGTGSINPTTYPFEVWSGTLDGSQFTGTWVDVSAQVEGWFNASVSDTSFQGHWFIMGAADTGGHIWGTVRADTVDTVYGTWSNPNSNPFQFGTMYSTSGE